jgi:TPR repeat protein
MKLTHKHKHSLAAIILMLSLAAPVAAGPLEDSRAAYERGDFATAVRLFRSLAEQGNAIAQYNLGLMYYKGEGVSQSYPEAVAWYHLAAWQGDASAQLRLGFMYYNGQGTPQNYAEAVTWFRKAADQGSAEAQISLGAMYANGRGVSQDYVRAHVWLSLAAAQGNQNAVKSRDMVAQHMTQAQIVEAQKLAREWKPTTQPPPR